MIKVDELKRAIANRWDDIAAALGADRTRVEYELIGLLRQLEVEPGAAREAVVQAILALFQPHAHAYQLLLQAVRDTDPARAKGAGKPAGFVARERYTTFPVFYGTDRAGGGAAGAGVGFSGERGELSYGVAGLNQIVFAAPDVDAATFKDLAQDFRPKAKRFTLYASSDDLALKASKVVHKYSRAGESGLDLVVTESVDTVDVTAVDTSLLGHAYYGENRSVLSDLFYVIRNGTPPDDRFGLVAKDRYGARYWSFRPS